jgi:integrase/recombinase XerD
VAYNKLRKGDSVHSWRKTIAMETIALKPLFHRGQESIGLYYDNLPSLNGIVRKLPDAKWSQTNKVWYVPLTPDYYNEVYKALNGKAKLNTTALKNYLEKRKKVTATLPALPKTIITKPIAASAVWKLSKENLEALEKFIERLKLKAYSTSTIRTYRNEFLQLLQLLKNKQVNDLKPDDLRRYMVYAMEKEGINENNH